MSTEKDILIVEPFNGGSHGQLIKLLQSDHDIGQRCLIVSLPAKKWHWRARTSALAFSQTIPYSSSYRVLFSSSVLNLAELIALRPDLAQLKKIVYFHENQLVYPVRKTKERDFQYGYNQILTSLVADVVVFNSTFNMESFLSSISRHLKLIPDHRPKNLEAVIRPKCRVLYFPIIVNHTCDNGIHSLDATNSDIPSVDATNSDIQPVDATNRDNHSVDSTNREINSIDSTNRDSHSLDSTNKDIKSIDSSNSGIQLIVSTSTNSHSGNPTNRDIYYVDSANLDIHSCNPTNRDIHSNKHTNRDIPCVDTTQIREENEKEHDKDPESFFKALLQLQTEGFDFVVSVVGETFTDVPEIFDSMKPLLADKILAWGYQPREDYLRIMNSAHVVVSTALHEFFGVAVLEATAHGCYPLCPKRLVYPELYPAECLYATQSQLVKELKRFCQRPSLAKTDKFKILVEKFSWQNLQGEYKKLLLD
ncbi:unnamed protein product [Candidula unifasciata]|uniref:tRNA-queuosine alpha-mannosyltransferase n=1 Tax=Candidula unifasciata TaxID=100452 RepID=A0A8S3YVA5_9EUPU|nr:unnamed protein product [Candidula unifasciata]